VIGDNWVQWFTGMTGRQRSGGEWREGRGVGLGLSTFTWNNGKGATTLSPI